MRGFAWRCINHDAECVLLFLSEAPFLPNGQGFYTASDGSIVTFSAVPDAISMLENLSGDIIGNVQTTNLDIVARWANRQGEEHPAISEVESTLAMISTLWVTKKNAPPFVVEEYDPELEDKIFQEVAKGSLHSLSELDENSIRKTRNMLRVGLKWIRELMEKS